MEKSVWIYNSPITNGKNNMSDVNKLLSEG